MRHDLNREPIHHPDQTQTKTLKIDLNILFKSTGISCYKIEKSNSGSVNNL